MRKSFITHFVIAITITVAALASVASAYAETEIDMEQQVWSNPEVPEVNLSPLRNEFISYEIRQVAERGDREKSSYYLPLKLEESGGTEHVYSAKVDLPYIWLDREVFIRVEGFESFSVIVNNQAVGYSEDSRVPSEFNLSQYLIDGENSVIIASHNGSGRRLEYRGKGESSKKAHLFSQPKRRVHDYKITFLPDSVENCGVFTLEVVLANSYNSDESFSFGYDVYSPQNRLEHFDMREVEVKGNGVDTLKLSQKIWRTPGNEWSAESPRLYYGMLIVKVGTRIVEYVPYSVGYGSTEVKDGRILRNGKAIEMKTTDYATSGDKTATERELKEFKKRGINTIHTLHPQPIWFYDLCSVVGLYVVERTNIYSDLPSSERDNRRVDGTLSNNPDWLNSFASRIERTRARVARYDCIVGWSLGGADMENGYNMYKQYNLLKDKGDGRAVIFEGADGEWNSDIQ